jgi:hypothetical protein
MLMPYNTLSAAVSGLREKGFTEDFNLTENCLICNNKRFNPDDFEIKEVYRFEGPSDPGDSSIVYGIESKYGYMGVLINSYGYQSETLSDDIAKKLRITGR